MTELSSDPNRLSITQVIERICHDKACDHATAEHHLRAALAEGRIPAVLLGQERVEGCLLAALSSVPLKSSRLWLTAEIDFEDGTVLDFYLCPGQQTRQRRILLLSRAAIDRLWDDPAEMAAAAERSRANAQASAKWDFNERSWWRTDRVLRWLAWRDPDRINDDWRPERRYGKGTVSDPRPVLLRAVQDGTLKAYRNGKPMKPAAWARVEMHQLPDADFQKEEVLRVRSKDGDAASEPAAAANDAVSRAGIPESQSLAGRRKAENSRRGAAVKAQLEIAQPGQTVHWAIFCANVRAACGIKDPPPYGWKDKSIERDVKTFMKKHPDKSDNPDI